MLAEEQNKLPLFSVLIKTLSACGKVGVLVLLLVLSKFFKDQKAGLVMAEKATEQVEANQENTDQKLSRAEALKVNLKEEIGF